MDLGFTLAINLPQLVVTTVVALWSALRTGQALSAVAEAVHSLADGMYAVAEDMNGFRRGMADHQGLEDKYYYRKHIMEMELEIELAGKIDRLLENIPGKGVK